MADLEDKLKVGEEYENMIEGMEEKNMNEKGNNETNNYTPRSPKKPEIGIKQILVRQENKINQALFKVNLK